MPDPITPVTEKTATRAPSVGMGTDETTDGNGPATTFAPPAEPGEVGKLGPYRVLKQLGHGGMGAVYLGLDERLGRKIALKVMLPQYAANPAAKERFLREARAAAQITHDNIVTVHEADEQDGVPYISMQFLQGFALDEYLRKKGNPSIPQVLRIGRETAAGLAAAHKSGLVHRDIKPGNLWLEAPQGRVKILDFGLAKPVDAAFELTKSGVLIGTPAYMSPEQGRGHKVDARADLFSLGAVLYRLCTGKIPFEGPDVMAILTALSVDEPAPVRELNPAVPEPLAALVHQLLAKKAADRPQTADEVVKRIRGMMQNSPAAGPAKSPDAAGMVLLTVPPQSAFVEAPGDNSAPPPVPDVHGSPRKSRLGLLIGAAFAFLAACVLAGVIVIKITNKDGTVTELKVDDSSKIEINGKPVHVAPGSSGTAPSPGTAVPGLSPKPIPVGQSPFDKLDPNAIPKEERFDWQPKELVALIGSHARRHWIAIRAVVISPDGKNACTRGAHDLTLWDVETQQPLATFADWYPSFSEDGKTLFLHNAGSAAAVDLTKRPLVATAVAVTIPELGQWHHITRIENGRTLVAREYAGEHRAILVDISGNKSVVGGTLACSDSNGTADFYWSGAGVAVYRTPTGQLRRVEIKDAKFVNDLELTLGDGDGRPRAISADGKLVSLLFKDRGELWDIATTPPKKLHQMNPNYGLLNHQGFSPDGRWLATNYTQTALYRIDGSAPKLTGWLDQTSSGASDFSNIAFSQDGNRAVVGNSEGFVRFWDLSGPQPKELAPFDPNTAFQTQNGERNLALANPSGRVMLPRIDVSIYGERSRYRLWDLSAAQPCPVPDSTTFLEGVRGTIHPLPGGRWVGGAYGNSAAHLYDLRETGWRSDSGGFGNFSGCRVSPDGSLFVGFSGVHPTALSVEGWDLTTRPPSRKWAVGPRDYTVVSQQRYRALQISGDNRWFTTPEPSEKGNPWKLVLWRNDGPKPEVHAVIECKGSHALYRASFSPDGRYLAHTPDTTYEIVLTDLTGQEPREAAKFKGNGAIETLAFHPDGKKLAYGSGMGAGVLEIPTGKTLWSWKAPGPVTWLDWATDGRHLVTHNGNKTVYVLRLNDLGK